MKRLFSSCIIKKSTNQILFAVLFLESLAIVLAISGAMAAGHSPKAYFEEGGYMSILSCLQLLGGAFISRKIFLIAKNSSNYILNKSISFWQTATFGLSFLTFDEAFQIHEYADKLLHFLLKILFDFEETNISDLADDMIVGGYLLFLVVYVAKKWQSIQLFQNSFVYFKVGIGLTVLMIFLDTISNNTLFSSMFTENLEQEKMWEIWFGTLEDCIKIYAGGLFFIGIYQCWKTAKLMVRQ